MNQRPLVFSLPSYRYLTDALVDAADLELGKTEVRYFPDGERYQRIESVVQGRHVVLVGGTISDEATLTLYDLASAIVKYGAKRLTLIVPYFGYSTMERAARSGEVVTAKTRARLLSSIPIASKGNRIFLVDLHSEGIPHYFEGGLTAFHVYAKPAIVAAVRASGGEDFVVASTDAGRAKWVESLADDLAVDAAFVYKRRLSGASTRVTAVSAQVSGRRVVLYDDMIRTGGSLIGAAEAYRAAGASSLVAVATHAIFPGASFQRVRDSGLFERIVCTNTHPRAKELEAEGLETVCVAPLLAEAMLK